MKFGTECLDLVNRYSKDSKIKLIPSNANDLFKVTYKKDYFSALGMIRKKLTYRCLVFTDNAKEKINLNKFNLNLNLICSNDLDVNGIEFENVDDLEMERSNECSTIDVLFLFSKISLIKNLKDFISFNSNFNDLILIFQISTDKDKYELMNYSESFMKDKRLTILFSQDANPIDNMILFEKIKLICNNFNLMIGQCIKI